MTELYTPSYPDPWAFTEQPKLIRHRRGLFRRDKYEFRIPYRVLIPEEYAADLDNNTIVIPAGFTCDGRSTPIGTLMVRDHPAGWLHDWGYRLPEWVERLETKPEHTLRLVYGITLDERWDMIRLLSMSRQWWDDLFYAHLKAVGKEQNLISIDPRRTRAAHAISRPWQWAAVRLLGSGPFQPR